MPADEDGSTADQVPGGWRRRIVIVLAAVVVVHSALVALWLAPASPVRGLVGASWLSSYVDPYFWQSWAYVDPSRQRVDEALSIRAKYRENGKTKTTAWIDLTARELGSELRWGSARIHLAPRRLATNMNASMIGLDENQTKVARRDYLQADPVTAERGALAAAGLSPELTTQLVNNDNMVVWYSSLIARARWGAQVRQVQFKVGRRVAPSHASGRTISDVDLTWRTFGWKRAVRASEAAQGHVDDYVKGWA